MDKIPTVNEYLNSKNIHVFNGKDGFHEKNFNMIKNSLIEFAKLHVKAALEEALESIPCLGSSTDIATYEEVEKAVLNSYPLENIK